MSLKPIGVHVYHVFLASPSDVNTERQHVRRFFDEYNRHSAHLWGCEFRVIDWENYSTIGVGRPQELISQQTLEKFKSSLALVVGIMAQRFGSPTGRAESGTEEEFKWAKECHSTTGFPEIKWFFRKVDSVAMPTDPTEIRKALEQWERVLAFRQRMRSLNDPIFYTEYAETDSFANVFDHDLNLWLNDPARPWVNEIATSGRATIGALPVGFDSELYRTAVLKRFDKLNFEMLDSTGAYYSGVRLWTVFVPQSAREFHQYNPRLLELPKEHQQRLLKAEAGARESVENQRHAEEVQREYFQQPLRPVLEIIDQALRDGPSRGNRGLVILGDPGSGKSSLIRYLALRWASIADRSTREAQPIPLVIDLGNYARWECDGRKGFVRFLEEAPVWHDWPRGLLDRLLSQPRRLVLLLDGLDEIFDPLSREEVVNDIQRFSAECTQIPIVVTSRAVGYQAQRLRDAEFRHLMLQDLDLAQIDAFVDSWHEYTFDDAAQATPKRERLKRAIRDSRSIAMLAGNPLLLTMMAILNRNQELPRDRVDLYAQASRLLLHQWDTERALAAFPGSSADVGWREKHDLLRRIASFMQAGPSGLKGNIIDGPILTGLIEDYLHNELHFPQSRAAARAVVEHLRQRNFILCFVGADSYGFVHRTFLEYFCAADFVQRFNVAKTLDEAGLLALFDQHYGDDDWREVLRLICSQIDERFIAKIIERLATRTDLNQWDGNTPLPELPLAIYCLSEARNLARVERAASILLSKVIGVFNSANRPSRSLIEEIVSSSGEIGERWPGRLSVDFPITLRPAEFYHHGNWAKFVAVVTASRKKVLEFGTQGTWDVRRGAYEALAKHWPDEATQVLLRARAVEDPHVFARGAALEALVAKWPDEATQALLRARAVEDPHEYARRTALAALAATWPDAATLALLRARAIEDQHESARLAALEALVATWPDDATPALLRTRAVEDQHESARGAALALAAKWPDEATQALLRTRAVEDPHESARAAALEALAAKWPDEATQALLRARAVEDQHTSARRAALTALAATWPDEATQALLRARAVEDPHEYARGASFEALAAKWPDEATQGLLRARAVEDPHVFARGAALEVLVAKWPDEATQALLRARAVEDPHEYARGAALAALVAKWPDEATQALLRARAVEDPHASARGAALAALVAKWPDNATQALLRARAVEDQHDYARRAALAALAAKWPDGATQTLLRACAVEDPHESARRAALAALAAKWPDEATQALLRARAVEDPHEYARGAALAALVATWPDEATQALLRARAVEDQHEYARRAALAALVAKWPDEATQALLRARAIEDPHESARRAALAALVAKWPNDATQALLRARVVKDQHESARRAALEALAATWPDEATQVLLRARAVEDPLESVRRAALAALAVKWPDDASQALLRARAVEDPHEYARGASLEALAATWPDDATQALLRARAVEDQHAYARRAALEALAATWPDGATQALLRARAVEDPHASARRAALAALAATWPDDATQALARARAIEDPHASARRAALTTLVAKWPNDATQALLRARVVEDPRAYARGAALAALVATWPDEATQALLRARAIEDQHASVRGAALGTLMATWPDEATQALLRARAVEDPHASARRAALATLVAKWPDDATQALLRTRAVEDQHASVRGAALAALMLTWPDEATQALLRSRVVDH